MSHFEIIVPVVGKLMKSVNFVNPWSVKNLLTLLKVNLLIFLSDAKVKVELLIR